MRGVIPALNDQVAAVVPEAETDRGQMADPDTSTQEVVRLDNWRLLVPAGTKPICRQQMQPAALTACSQARSAAVGLIVDRPPFMLALSQPNPRLLGKDANDHLRDRLPALQCRQNVHALHRDIPYWERYRRCGIRVQWLPSAHCRFL